MTILILIVALAVLMTLMLLKFPTPIAALISVAVMAILSGGNPLNMISGPYMTSVASFIQANWVLLLMGVVLSKAMDVTGAAGAIADFLVSKLGKTRAIPAIIIAGGVLAFGGINGMALIFALYPITMKVFKEANLPRYLIPAVIVSALFTWVEIIPGSPIITQVIAGKVLHTNGMSGAIMGIVAGVIVLAFDIAYLTYAVHKAEAKGDGFVEDEMPAGPGGPGAPLPPDAVEEAPKTPNILVSFIPLVLVVILYNVFKMQLWVVLLIAAIVCLVLFFRSIKNFRGFLMDSAAEGSTMTIMAASAVGIGGAISAIPGFSSLIHTMVTFGTSGGNPIAVFGGGTFVLTALTSNGLVGLSSALQAMAGPLLKAGVNPAALHRIGIIASSTLDGLPYSGGLVALVSFARVSLRDSYKHVFFVSVLPMIVAFVVAILMGMVGIV